MNTDSNRTPPEAGKRKGAEDAESETVEGVKLQVEEKGRKVSRKYAKDAKGIRIKGGRLQVERKEKTTENTENTEKRIEESTELKMLETQNRKEEIVHYVASFSFLTSYLLPLTSRVPSTIYA